MTTGKYLCAESGGGTIIVANRTAASGWETFSVSEHIDVAQSLNDYNPIAIKSDSLLHFDHDVVLCSVVEAR